MPIAGQQGQYTQASSAQWSGPLTGTRVQAAPVMAVVSKSPGALPESHCYVNIGGR